MTREVLEIAPHRVLGIEPGASRREIEAAYHRARQNLGSRSGGPPDWISDLIDQAYQCLNETTESDRQIASAPRRPSPKPALALQSTAAWRQQLPLQNESTYFILLNVLDIFMTYLLLNFHAVEANPIADYFYQHWGFRGMIAFKLILVAFVCITAQIVARRNLPYARGILWTGIVIVGVVVIYSVRLLAGEIG